MTITSDAAVTQVSKITVTVQPQSGSAITKDFTPPMKDGGAINTPFFERISLPDSAGGTATVTADAYDASNTKFAWGSTTADIEKNHAVAAQVKLYVGGPPAPDGGVGGHGGGAGGAGGEAGAGSEGGAATGVGGESGRSGGGGHAGGGGAAATGGRGNGGRGNGGAGGLGLGLGGLGGS